MSDYKQIAGIGMETNWLVTQGLILKLLRPKPATKAANCQLVPKHTLLMNQAILHRALGIPTMLACLFGHLNKFIIKMMVSFLECQ